MNRKLDIKYQIILPSLSIVLSCLTHILDYGVIVLITVIYILACLIVFRKPSIIREPYMLTSLIVLATIFAIIMVYPPIVGNDSLKIIYFINNLVGTSKNNEAGHQPIQNPLITINRPSPLYAGLYPQIYFVFIYTILFTTLLLTLAKRYQNRIPIFSMTCTLMALNLPFIPFNWLMRFMLITGFLLPYLLAWLIGLKDIHKPLIVGILLAAVSYTHLTLPTN